jgi:hypothetical protein
VQKITELNHPPIVGETYLVPCVIFPDSTLEKYPVIGDFHDDKEIGFPLAHIHPDYRFFTEDQFQKAFKYATKSGKSLALLAYSSKNNNESILYWEVRLCLRDFPVYSIETLDAILMRRLERLNKSSKLICGFCPHKGANLNSIAPDKHGNKVCPLHNLMWNKDGNLVPRFGDST